MDLVPVMEAAGCEAGTDPPVTDSRSLILTTTSPKSVRPPSGPQLPSSPPQNVSCPALPSSPPPPPHSEADAELWPVPTTHLEKARAPGSGHRRGHRSQIPSVPAKLSARPSQLLGGSHEVTDIDVLSVSYRTARIHLRPSGTFPLTYHFFLGHPHTLPLDQSP